MPELLAGPAVVNRPARLDLPDDPIIVIAEALARILADQHHEANQARTRSPAG